MVKKLLGRLWGGGKPPTENDAVFWPPARQSDLVAEAIERSW